MEFKTSPPEENLTDAARGLVKAYRTVLGLAVGFAVIAGTASIADSTRTRTQTRQEITTVKTVVNSRVDNLETKVDRAIQVFDERVTKLENKPNQEYTPQEYRDIERPMHQEQSIIPASVERLFRIAPELTTIVHADKARNTLAIYTPRGIVLTVPASYGSNPFPKSEIGDRATPEGIYRVLALDAYPDKKFGSRKINLNYPNMIDKTLSRTGGGIVMCGAGTTERELAVLRGENFSHGGIILTDYDAERVYAMISRDPKRTAYIIETQGREAIP
jgi:hypothetical protein